MDGHSMLWQDDSPHHSTMTPTAQLVFNTIDRRFHPAEIGVAKTSHRCFGEFHRTGITVHSRPRLPLFDSQLAAHRGFQFNSHLHLLARSGLKEWGTRCHKVSEPISDQVDRRWASTHPKISSYAVCRRSKCGKLAQYNKIDQV